MFLGFIEMGHWSEIVNNVKTEFTLISFLYRLSVIVTRKKPCSVWHLYLKSHQMSMVLSIMFLNLLRIDSVNLLSQKVCSYRDLIGHFPYDIETPGTSNTVHLIKA